MKYLGWFFILLAPHQSSEDIKNILTIWNVGQGNWATLSNPSQCWHFDVGGESFPIGVKSLCYKKENYIFLSHDDWDHLRFLKKVRSWPKVCLVSPPRKSFSKAKKRLIENLSPCPEIKTVQELKWPTKGKNPNDLSRIYFLKDPGVLFPGDSTRGEEKIWAQQLTKLKVKWWLLGHHGSLTSSSNFLLENIGRPLGAIVTARWRAYRHPHPKVEARIKHKGIPILRTEDWGHIHIEI